MIRKTLQSARCLCLSPLLIAQQTAVPRQGQNEIQPLESASGSATVTLPKGTQFKFALLDEISSATAKNGQLVRLVVTQDVRSGSTLVIFKGALATGRVTNLHRPVAGKRDGDISVKPVELKLKGGSVLKLREYAPGEDACGDLGPCWAMHMVFVPLYVICFPLILAKRAERNPNFKGILGKDATLKSCSPVIGFTTRRYSVAKAVGFAATPPQVHPSLRRSCQALIADGQQ